MHFAVPDLKPETSSDHGRHEARAPGASSLLFLLTIATAVSFHSFLHLPPVHRHDDRPGLPPVLRLFPAHDPRTLAASATRTGRHQVRRHDALSTSSIQVARAEWDTLLFFYGVVLCVGGLGFIGYLALASDVMYLQWGPTAANIGVGLISAVVDNIPVMFAVLTMNPDMVRPSGCW